ncbi:MAG: hypothetical protein IKB93_12085 [Clostridia bacterium]|nr:hypothetical protein [Clostridia bacterium]
MIDKLTICFNPWMVYSKNDNYDVIIGEIAERGFNCIRIDDGAGLLWDGDGNVRNNFLISVPFGSYTEHTTYKVIVDKEELNILDRLLRICFAAKKHNIKVILSSWFLLHTNWFCQECDVNHIFNMPPEQKITYFAEELKRILDTLKSENLIDVVAFAEILNEFDNIPWYRNHTSLTAEEATGLRIVHEREIDKLKKNHPDILFAYDAKNVQPMKEIIPRNIDVFNFHHYYAWNLYDAFENGLCFDVLTLDEPEIPDKTRYFLKNDILSVKDVADTMNSDIKTGPDWPRRISLYASIDYEKEPELNQLLEKSLKENMDFYRSKFLSGVDTAIAIHDSVVPNSKIVMGEGVTYCASPALTFEKDSKHFWELIMEQMIYFNKRGLWGSIVATTHAPDRSTAWEPCKDLYIQANRCFTDGK